MQVLTSIHDSYGVHVKDASRTRICIRVKPVSSSRKYLIHKRFTSSTSTGSGGNETYSRNARNVGIEGLIDHTNVGFANGVRLVRDSIRIYVSVYPRINLIGIRPVMSSYYVTYSTTECGSDRQMYLFAMRSSLSTYPYTQPYRYSDSPYGVLDANRVGADTVPILCARIIFNCKSNSCISTTGSPTNTQDAISVLDNGSYASRVVNNKPFGVRCCPSDARCIPTAMVI